MKNLPEEHNEDKTYVIWDTITQNFIGIIDQDSNGTYLISDIPKFSKPVAEKIRAVNEKNYLVFHESKIPKLVLNTLKSRLREKIELLDTRIAAIKTRYFVVIPEKSMIYKVDFITDELQKLCDTGICFIIDIEEETFSLLSKSFPVPNYL